MILRYLPTTEIYINNVSLRFGDQRESVRTKLGGRHEESNKIIPLGELAEPIVQRRDIYDSLNSSEEFFFLDYDKNDLLAELEVHRCEKIQIFDLIFDFASEIDWVAKELSKYSSIDKKGDGEYFLKELHISIIDERQMGGEDKSTISYFYCAADVSHLE
jgi:hypothetical protein